MLKDRTALIKRELDDGTGATIALDVVDSGAQSGLDIWFADLKKRAGPLIELRKKGLRSHVVKLKFGSFARNTLHQIAAAPAEDVQLARALVLSIANHAKIDIPDQNLNDWEIKNGSFGLTAEVRHQLHSSEDDALVVTCADVIVPLMAALAELIGYDEVHQDLEEGEVEGTVSLSMVKKRERNPRNRLLCLRVHGYECKCCGLKPPKKYGEAGKILEVHHLQPLSNLSAPRAYDPASDLVLLCPNCHRAVHTKRPEPLSIDDLRAILRNNG